MKAMHNRGHDNEGLLINHLSQRGLPEEREPIRLLVFSASMRRGSLNSQLAELAAGSIEYHGGIVDRAAMSDFDMPLYDQDVQQEAGFPPGADRLRHRLQANDAFVISSPEYNASMPGVI